MTSWKKKRTLISKFFYVPCPLVLTFPASLCSFHRRIQTPPDLLSQKRIFLLCVLVCHGEVHEMWNKSHLPVLTSYDNRWLPRCCNGVHVRCPWSSAQSYQMGKNMSNERCSSMPRQNHRRMSCIWSDLKSPLTPQKAQSIVLLPPEKWWDDGWSALLGLGRVSSGSLALPCMEGTRWHYREVLRQSQAWAILPFWTVRAGCACLHGQTTAGHGCSSYISTRLPWSPGLTETPWSCRLLNRGYGPPNTDTKHRENLNQLILSTRKTLINSCNLWNLFPHKDGETLRGQKAAPSQAMSNVFSSLQYKRQRSELCLWVVAIQHHASGCWGNQFNLFLCGKR